VSAPHRRPLTLVVMGVSGAGKSSVMAALASRVPAAIADGDAFHLPANVAKMAAGIPLTDADRLPWLEAIADRIGAQERAGTDAIVACSALRRSYRDILRTGNPGVRFVHLTADRDLLMQRLATRRGHYMPPSLLDSQLATLEPLQPDEPGITVVADRSPGDLADEILKRIGWDRHEKGRGVARPEVSESTT
jgi:gluconokinase